MEIPGISVPRSAQNRRKTAPEAKKPRIPELIHKNPSNSAKNRIS